MESNDLRMHLQKIIQQNDIKIQQNQEIIRLLKYIAEEPEFFCAVCDNTYKTEEEAEECYNNHTEEEQNEATEENSNNPTIDEQQEIIENAGQENQTKKRIRAKETE